MIKNHKSHLTLPSIGNWKNLNIKKDPPKSIHTKRKDKVGSDKLIQELHNSSGDRIEENINYYARGVNPMVKVQYSNYNGTPSRLPYRLDIDKNFKPNMEKSDAILGNLKDNWRFKNGTKSKINELNRLKNKTESFSPDFSIDDIEPDLVISNSNIRKNIAGPESYEIKKGDISKYEKLKDLQMLQRTIGDHLDYQVETRKTQNLEKHVEKTYDIEHHIQDKVKYQTNSGERTRDILQRTNADINENYIDKNYNLIDANTIKGSELTINNDIMKLSSFNTEKYVDDSLKGIYNTNKKESDYKRTYIKSKYEEKTKNKTLLQGNIETYKNKQKGQDYIHKNIELDKVLPAWKSSTNTSINLQKIIPHEKEIYLDNNRPNTQIQSINRKSIGDDQMNQGKFVKLNPTIERSTFDPRPNMPRQNMVNNYRLKSDRLK